jgi:trans-aconitate methyltransferase
MNEMNFKWNASLYQKHSPVQNELGLRAINKLDPHDGEKILEIGCGNGLITIRLAKLIPNSHIIAVEPSKEMAEQAKNNFTQNSVNNVTIVNMDALNINFQNEFNAVFSNSAIHWIKKQEMIYELIYNSLKDNGRIQIQTGLKKINPYSQALINVGIEYREYLKNFKPPWRFLTKQETEKILRELNFKDISVEIYPYIAKFDTIAGIGNYFKAAGFVPFSQNLPKNRHNEFIEKFKKEILKINQPNPLELKMDRLFISAKKIL